MNFKTPLLFTLFLVSACGGGGSDGSGGQSTSGSQSESQSSVDSSNSVSVGDPNSKCGLVVDEKLQTAPSRSRMIRVTAEVIGSDTVIITPTEGSNAGNKQLIKLHGVSSAGVPSLRILHGIDVMKRELEQGASFIPAGNDCEFVSEGGGQGSLGQIFSPSGQNMSELMIAEGSVKPVTDICGGDLLAACYSTIPLTQRSPSDIELDAQSVSLPSQCGSVVNGSLQNPVSSAELVRVEGLSSSHALVTRLLGVEAGNSQLIKLHGLSSEGLSEAAKINAINFITSPESYLRTESLSCLFDIEGAGLGVPGQLFTREGLSVNEELIKRGFAFNSLSDPCGGELLSACYQTLREAAPIVEDVVIGEGGEELTGEGFTENLIRNFLWKPKSERDGNLAILVNPLDVRVVVTGSATETLTNTGPSNGRGTTARARRSGCAFGPSVVTFFNSSGQQIPVVGSGNSITIPDGCKRVEFRR